MAGRLTRSLLARAAVVAALAALVWPGACVVAPAVVAAAPGSAGLPWQQIDQPAVLVCGRCHQDVYAEWARSLHRGAWTNENVRTATQDFSKKACRACHSPESIWVRGLHRRPPFRDANHEDGVHCLSCHGLEDGVAASRTIPDAPCRPRYEPRLLQADACYPCHEPTHQAFAEYRRSDAFATGIRCVDCHMQPTVNRRGRSHGPHGGFDEEFVRRALAWRCALAGRVVEITLRNRCGHKFPGEIPSRSFLVEVRFAGIPEAEPVQVLLRRPFKGEKRADNRLLPDEERVLRVPMPEGATGAKVRLLFRPLPLMPLDQAFSLGSWST